MDASTTSLLWDFLSFRVLMTPAILVVVYYFGAIVVPLAIILLLQNARQAAGDIPMATRRGRLRESFLGDHRGKLVVAGVLLFIMMEIFWRMMFEFFIAYFQIHNALMGMG